MYSPSMSEIDFETRCKASKSSVFNFQGYSNEILWDLRSSYFFTNLSEALHIKKYWYISCLEAAKFWQIYVARVIFQFFLFSCSGWWVEMASFVSQLAGLVSDSFFRKKNDNDSDEVSSVPIMSFSYQAVLLWATMIKMRQKLGRSKIIFSINDWKLKNRWNQVIVVLYETFMPAFRYGLFHFAHDHFNSKKSSEIFYK